MSNYSIENWFDALGCHWCHRDTLSEIEGHDGLCPVPMVVSLLDENTKLREALYGEYCDCNGKDATIIPSTHHFSCKYRIIMQRIISQGEKT